MVSPVVQAADVRIHIQGKQTQTVVALYTLEQNIVVPHVTKKHSLYQKGKNFSPKLITLTQGSMVNFINDDVVYHNVFSMSEAKEFDLGLYPHGDHREVVFDKIGVVRVFCAIHPDMFAQLVIVDTAWSAVVDEQGKAMLKDVPMGNYEVRIWDMKNNFIKKNRTIKVGKQALQVNL